MFQIDEIRRCLRYLRYMCLSEEKSLYSSRAVSSLGASIPEEQTLRSPHSTLPAGASCEVEHEVRYGIRLEATVTRSRKPSAQKYGGRVWSAGETPPPE